MAPQPGLQDDRPNEEATAWLIALSERPDDSDMRARFAAWRDAHPAHAAAWAETSHTYNLLAPALRRPQHRRVMPRRLALGFAAAGLAAGLAAFAGPGILLSMRADHRTGTNETRDVRLQDGSTVSLGPESSLAVLDSGARRGAHLLAGRAFFDVAADATRPFEVQAGDIRVIVLGTAFEVKMNEDGTKVSVQHGRVQVDGQDGATAPRLLSTGEWVKVRRNGKIAAGAGMPDQIGTWRKGQLFVIDRPIADVIDEMRPYFKGAIVLTDQALGRRRVTGIYNLREPFEGLRAVAGAHKGATVRQVSPWLIVVSAL